jgi:hypothetical protein
MGGGGGIRKVINKIGKPVGGKREYNKKERN